MNTIIGGYTPTLAESGYARVTRLCLAALTGPVVDTNEEHQEVLSLLPQGMYRHYKGTCHYVLGIGLTVSTVGRVEYFAFLITPEDNGEARFARWALVGTEHGEKTGWFIPVRKKNRDIPRFTLEQKMTLAEFQSGICSKASQNP